MDTVMPLMEPQLAPPSCKTAETTRGFFSDPALSLAPLQTSPQSAPPSVPMGACYPKCMGSADDVVRPGVQFRRDEASSLASKLRTFDLEELGLPHANPPTKQLESIVVDYEDSDGEHPQLRDDAATCAASACAPLTKPRHRPDVSSLKGKSVIVQQQQAEPPTDEEPRCSSVHKLCMCEVKLHRSLASCWLVSSGQVYDVTGLVTAHPGGVRSILRKAGGPDCARDMKFHTKNARKMMEKCFIGKLQQCGDAVCADDSNCSIM